MRSRTVRLALTVLLPATLVLGACKKQPPPPRASSPVAPIERPTLAGPRSIAASGAFDLAPVQSGVLLVWGPPTRTGGGVKGVLLDRFGSVLVNDLPIHTPRLPAGGTAAERIAPDAIEVAAASAGGRVGVVWVERDQLDLRLRGAIGDAATGQFGPAQDAGPTERATLGGRGWLAIGASPEGQFTTVLRGVSAPCEDGAASRCALFRVLAFAPTGFTPRGVPLAMPDPCPSAVVGVGMFDRRLAYAVCGRDGGRQVTTLYAIQPEPQFARADPILPGCEPDALALVDGELVVTGTCAGGRAGVRGAMTGPRPLAMENVHVSCEGPRAVVSTGGELGLRTTLRSPVARLEAILPEAIAPRGARAVWTGESLVVAVPLQGEVALRRYECEAGEFLRTDIL